MKTITVAVPDKIQEEMSAFVKNGWFENEQDMMRAAIQEFIRRNNAKLIEGFMHEDIEWAVRQKADHS